MVACALAQPLLLCASLNDHPPCADGGGDGLDSDKGPDGCEGDGGGHGRVDDDQEGDVLNGRDDRQL